jgi:RNA polymerase sigma-70 factor (ECF subfamily)
MPSSSKVVRLSDVRKPAGQPATGGGAPATSRLGTGVRPAPPGAEDDPDELAHGLRAGETWAQHALLARHTEHLERILTRILGRRADLDDLVQEVFVRAFERVGELREPRALRAWITTIAVFVAREAIRAKRRRRWLLFLPPEETPELPVLEATPEVRAAVRSFYAVVGALDADARIAFTLRFVEGMELADIAHTTGVSLSTVKRRLKGAEADFLDGARAPGHEPLRDWIEEGTRWRGP